jgi:hypothetical protein
MSLLTLLGCTWIGPKELADRLDDTGSDCPIEVSEPLPDTTTATMQADYVSLLPEATTTADLGELAPCPLLLTGTLGLTGVNGWGSNDSDAWTFTLPEPATIQLNASWHDDADLDFGVWGEGEDGVWSNQMDTSAADGCTGNTNPARCTTPAPLQADTTYYLLALGYLGAADTDDAYTITLEWE